MSDSKKTERSECELRRANGIAGVACDGSDCTFWHLVEHLDVAGSATGECAIQHFELLGDAGAEVADWLWSVKQRVERISEEQR